MHGTAEPVLHACEACGQGYYLDAIPPHANTCPRFTCSKCGVKFGIIPEPLHKRFGVAPLCIACKAAHGAGGSA